MAYCDIQDAVTLSTNQYILVAGHGTAHAYGFVQISGRTLTIVGPAGDMNTAAAIQGGLSNRGLLILDDAIVTVYGLDIASASTDAVACKPINHPATLKLIRSNVHSSLGVGVLSDTCTLLLDGNWIGPQNANGGIKLTLTNYLIVNNFIFNNGRGTYPGVYLSGDSNGSFAFNTIARNTILSGIGGIDCSSVTKVIEASIVVGNDGTTSQLGSTCALINVITDPTDSQGTHGMPVFVSGSDFHLLVPNTNNNDCCIDKISTTVDGGISMLPRTDVDGEPRPQGLAWDIGADEAE
jgi:hypothetical protein